MLLRRCKHSSASKALVKRLLVKQCVAVRYISSNSSDQPTDNSHDAQATVSNGASEPSLADRLIREETEKRSFTQFWEVKTQGKKPKTRVNHQPMAKETKDFRNLLDSVFSNIGNGPKQSSFDSYASPSATMSSSVLGNAAKLPLTPPKKQSQTVAEKSLIGIVVRRHKPYRPKAPLPRHYQEPFHQRATQLQALRSKLHEESLIDYYAKGVAAAAASTSNLLSGRSNISESERFRIKDQEMMVLQTIVESRTPTQLLACITKEINTREPAYPPYYPTILKKAIEHAATSQHMQDPYLALTIFEQAKHRSMTSYIMGCTTRVYNSVLNLRWDMWRDIYGILDLVEEMSVNGIVFDNESKRLVREMTKELTADSTSHLMGGTGDKANVPFWNEEERKYCRITKELVDKWLVTE